MYLFIGQVLDALGGPFYQVPHKVSAMWFMPDERARSTTFMTVFLYVGSAAGSFIPTYFVDTDASGEKGLE